MGSKINELDDDQLNEDGLSPEEIAALKDDEDTGEGSENDDEQEGGDQEEVEESTDGKEKTDDDAADVDESAASDDKPAEESDQQDTVVSESADQAQLREYSDRLEKIKTDMGDVQGKMDALVEQFENDEMDFAEYNKAFNELNDQKTRLVIDESRAEDRIESIREASDRTWKEEQENFFTSEGNEILRGLPTLFEAMNARVIEYANMKEYASASGEEVLRMAKADVLKDTALIDSVKGQFGVDLRVLPVFTGQSKNDPPPKSDKQDLGPKTLVDVPASDADAGNDDNPQFAALDKLLETDPERYEIELAKLPKDVQEAYAVAS